MEDTLRSGSAHSIQVHRISVSPTSWTMTILAQDRWRENGTVMVRYPHCGYLDLWEYTVHTKYTSHLASLATGTVIYKREDGERPGLWLAR